MKIEFKNIKNIIFDLGGVILNIEYQLTVEAFKKLGVDNFEQQFSQAQQTHLFDLYEKGQLSSPEFRNEVKKHLGNHLSDTDIDHAWNALLLDLPAERLVLLNKVKAAYPTFLLSNTNDIHIETFNANLKNTYGLNNLSEHFHKLYLSYEVGMRKPDAEIFELVLSENKLKPEETLFIDDSPQHIASAQQLGIQAYWLDVKKETIVDLFEREKLI